MTPISICVIVKITFHETFFGLKDLTIKKVASKTRHNTSNSSEFEKLYYWVKKKKKKKKMTEGLSKCTAQYAGYLIIVKGSSK